MNSAGVSPQSLVQKWQFGVEIAGFNSAYFTKSGFPETEFDEVAFNPAGSLFPQKTAGRVKFNDITMEKGIPQDNPETNILDWVSQCVTILAATGGVPSDYMRDVDLVRYDRAGKEIARFRLHQAFIKTAKLGDADGSSSDNEIESLTLCYQYFTRV